MRWQYVIIYLGLFILIAHFANLSYLKWRTKNRNKQEQGNKK